MAAKHIVTIWGDNDNKEQKKTTFWGSDNEVQKKAITAEINFETDKPQCDRCYNPNKRVVVKFRHTDII